MAMRLAGEAIDEREAEGGRISDETLLVLLNAHHEDQAFTLPESGGDRRVRLGAADGYRAGRSARAVGRVSRGRATRTRWSPRALALFRRVEPPA